MRLLRLTRPGLLALLALCPLLIGCGSHDTTSEQTAVQLPTITAPQLAPTQTQASAGGTAHAQTTTGAPATGAPATRASATSGRRTPPDQGGRQPTEQNTPDRRRQRECQQKVAQLPAAQRPSALSDCLHPTPTNSEGSTQSKP